MDLHAQKTAILEEGLHHVAFDGWTVQTFETAARQAGYDPLMVMALFPRGERDLMDFFALWADQRMLDVLQNTNVEPLRIRDRIRVAVETRLSILSPHKEAVNVCFKKLLLPQNARLAMKITWRTADIIWDWAGDTSDDYNRYTKRGLLSGVISTTMAYWFQDQSDSHVKTSEFLNRRIDNVLFVGKNAGKIINPVAKLAGRFIVPTIQTIKDKIKV